MSELPRLPEPELMEDPLQTEAYAAADFTATDQAVVERIADLGCGPGTISFRLAERFQKALWQTVRQLLARHASGAPPVLRRDDPNSLHAAITSAEVKAQLAAAGLAGQVVREVDKRDLEIHGRLVVAARAGRLGR